MDSPRNEIIPALQSDSSEKMIINSPKGLYGQHINNYDIMMEAVDMSLKLIPGLDHQSSFI